METIRAFIAAPLPPIAKQELGAVVEKLAERVPSGSVRWVKPELMHLTLRFLGETAVTKLSAVKQAIDRAAASQAPLTLVLNETGCFPNANRPRVIWLGLAGEIAALAALKANLDERLIPLGWQKEERPFQAHLTVGRVKETGSVRTVEWRVMVQQVAIPVTAVHLIESQLTPQGPIYTVRHISRL